MNKTVKEAIVFVALLIIYAAAVKGIFSFGTVIAWICTGAMFISLFGLVRFYERQRQLEQECEHLKTMIRNSEKYKTGYLEGYQIAKDNPDEM